MGGPLGLGDRQRIAEDDRVAAGGVPRAGHPPSGRALGIVDEQARPLVGLRVLMRRGLWSWETRGRVAPMNWPHDNQNRTHSDILRIEEGRDDVRSSTDTPESTSTQREGRP